MLVSALVAIVWTLVVLIGALGGACFVAGIRTNL